jgi:NAD(P)-dependent dehydrogenase (short-subunit alcohol dehydrogenase family)
MGRLVGRIALITGASRGIGAAVARRFAKEGARLVLAARTVGGLEEVDDAVRASGGQATLVPMDLTDGAAIDQLGGAIHEQFGRLDILVGNAAALGTLGPVAHIEPTQWDAVVALNLTANYRLIRSIDPLLRQSDAGRAIFVSSGAARGRNPFWGAYAATKAGLEALVKTYAAEMAETSVRANLVNPGAQRTEMRAAAFPGELPESLPHPDERTGVFVDLADTACDKNGEILEAY